MSQSTNLRLPYLAANQAQKHVTVNEAFRFLDALVQLSIKSAALSAPPGSPADGNRYIVAAAPTGAWAGRDARRRLAGRRLDAAGAAAGLAAWVVDEASFLAWNGSAWVAAGLPAFFSDAVFELAHDADPTRRAVFDLAAIAAGVIRGSLQRGRSRPRMR